MPSSLEFATEEFFIRLFGQDSRSAGKALLHFDEDSNAASNAVVFQAKEGAQHQPADPGCSEIEMMIEYRSPIGTNRAERDQGAALIHQVVYQSQLSIPEKTAIMTSAGLSKILIKEESAGDRENTADLRKRTVTLPVVAKLA